MRSDIKRGKREVFVPPALVEKDQWLADETQEEQTYEVPAGKHLRVHEGDRVRAGDRLSEGPVNPHDILRIKGPRAVQEYLLNEVQERNIPGKIKCKRSTSDPTLFTETFAQIGKVNGQFIRFKY